MINNFIFYLPCYLGIHNIAYDKEVERKNKTTTTTTTTTTKKQQQTFVHLFS